MAKAKKVFSIDVFVAEKDMSISIKACPTADTAGAFDDLSGEEKEHFLNAVAAHIYQNLHESLQPAKKTRYDWLCPGAKARYTAVVGDPPNYREFKCEVISKPVKTKANGWVAQVRNDLNQEVYIRCAGLKKLKGERAPLWKARSTKA